MDTIIVNITEVVEEINVSISDPAGPGGGGVTSHPELSNRDAEDSHPIGAITGLQRALDDRLLKALQSGRTVNGANDIAAGDLYTVIRYDSPSGANITVPDSVMPVGAWFYIEIIGAGVPAIVAGSGTVNDHDLTDRLLVYVYRSTSTKLIVI